MLLCHCAVRWKLKKGRLVWQVATGLKRLPHSPPPSRGNSPEEEERKGKAHTDRHLPKPFGAGLRQQQTTLASYPVALKCLAKHTSPGNFHHAQHNPSICPNWHALICTLKATSCSVNQIKLMKICRGDQPSHYCSELATSLQVILWLHQKRERKRKKRTMC